MGLAWPTYRRVPSPLPSRTSSLDLTSRARSAHISSTHSHHISSRAAPVGVRRPRKGPDSTGFSYRPLKYNTTNCNKKTRQEIEKQHLLNTILVVQVFGAFRCCVET